MPFPVYILGYGTMIVPTTGERDKYNNLNDAFLPSFVNSGHTNMDSQVRLTKDNPLKNAEYNSVGLAVVPINPITTVIWDATYNEKAQVTSNITDQTVDKYSPVYNPSLSSSTPSPCGAGTCNIFLVEGVKVYVWDFSATPKHHTGSVPHNAGSIASYNNGGINDVWYVGDEAEFNMWSLDLNTCDSTWTRQIPYGPSPHPLGIINASSIKAGSFGNIIITGAAQNSDFWITEMDVSGAVTVNTDLFQLGTNVNAINPPPGHTFSAIYALVHLPMPDEIITAEYWHRPATPNVPMLVVRNRALGTIICSVETTFPTGRTHGLFCFNSKIFGTHYDNSGATHGIYEIMYDPAIPAITYDPTMLSSNSGGGASSDPGCCGTTTLSPITLAGYCCVDNNGNPPHNPSNPFSCTNATANCGGNNCDGTIAVWMGAVPPNPVISYVFTGTITLIDQNNVVISTASISSSTPTGIWWTFSNLCTGTYTVNYSNLVVNGQSHNDLNVGCMVIGDTPFDCITNPSCCLQPSWDCVNGGCVDPGTGLGEYATLEECQPACCSVPTPHEHMSDFDVCIDCDNTIIY